MKHLFLNTKIEYLLIVTIAIGLTLREIEQGNLDLVVKILWGSSAFIGMTLSSLSAWEARLSKYKTVIAVFWTSVLTSHILYYYVSSAQWAMISVALLLLYQVVVAYIAHELHLKDKMLERVCSRSFCKDCVLREGCPQLREEH